MTSFEDIYSLNQAIMTDNTLTSLGDNLYYYLLSTYLDFAIAEFRGDCFQDLDDITSFDQEIYGFTGDNTTTDFVLSPAPPTSDDMSTSFYITVNDVEIASSAYTYDSGTYTISFSTAPAASAVIYIGAYIIGYFTDDLNRSEKRILAQGMTIPFIEGQINKTKSLNQIIYGRGSGMHSQANHNKVNLEILDSKYQRLHQMIAWYTYTDDPDSLDNLASISTLGSDSDE